MRAVSKCSADSCSLHCRRLTPPPPPMTRTHVAQPMHCRQVLRRLQLSPLPSADTANESTAETDTHGGIRSTLDTAVCNESCVERCSAASSSLHCRRLTPPPPPADTDTRGAIRCTVDMSSADSSSLNCRRLTPTSPSPTNVPPTDPLSTLPSVARAVLTRALPTPALSTAVG